MSYYYLLLCNKVKTNDSTELSHSQKNSYLDSVPHSCWKVKRVVLLCLLSCYDFFFLILHCFSFRSVTWAFPLSLLVCNFQEQGSSAYFWNNNSEVTEQVEYHETQSIQSHRFHYFQISNQFWEKGTQNTLSISFLLLLPVSPASSPLPENNCLRSKLVWPTLWES